MLTRVWTGLCWVAASVVAAAAGGRGAWVVGGGGSWLGLGFGSGRCRLGWRRCVCGVVVCVGWCWWWCCCWWCACLGAGLGLGSGFGLGSGSRLRRTSVRGCEGAGAGWGGFPVCCRGVWVACLGVGGSPVAWRAAAALAFAVALWLRSAGRGGSEPVDVVDYPLKVLQSAFRVLSVREVDTNPVKRKREREKDAGEGTAEEGVDHGHAPTSEPAFEGATSASGLHASPSPTTTTLPTPDPATATSTTITTPPMVEGTGFTGMPTYPAYCLDPSTTAFSEAITSSEPVASSSAPRWYAADYHHPLPATGAYVDVPGYATLSGLRRGHESCRSRSRGSGRSSKRSLTRSEINEALRGATSKIVGDVTQEIRAKLEPLIPPQVSPTVLGVSPH